MPKELGTTGGMASIKNELPDHGVAGGMVDGETETEGDVAFMGYTVAKRENPDRPTVNSSTSTTADIGVGTNNATTAPTGLLSSLASLGNQGALSDPVLAFQSLLALYKREGDSNSGGGGGGGGSSSSSGGSSRRKAMPKRILPSNYNPAPCVITKPEDVLKRVMCSLCQATFDRFTDLLAHHKNTHNSDLTHPLRCKACGRTQTSEAGLVHHQIYVCKMVERPYSCEVCTLKFQSEEMVWVHKCSGDLRKRFACEFCDHYKTESSSDLEKHMRIHTGDKCFRCDSCGFQTAWKKNLKEHMIKHSGLKPYICDYCGYSTADKHNLRAHRMKHGKDAEGFDCSVCGLGFDCYRALRAHKDTHSDAEKPFKCARCDYRAKYKSVLHIHEVRHDHLRKSACPVCGRLFSYHKEMLDHRASAHPGAEGAGEGESKALSSSTPLSHHPATGSQAGGVGARANVLSVPSSHPVPLNPQQASLSLSSTTTPQLQDASLLPQQTLPHPPPPAPSIAQQQNWKSPVFTHSLTQAQGLVVPSTFQMTAQQQQNMAAMQSFGAAAAGVIPPWPGVTPTTNVHDFFGARMALGQSANDSLLRQTAASLSQTGVAVSAAIPPAALSHPHHPHPSSFMACPLPVFPGLGDQLPGGAGGGR